MHNYFKLEMKNPLTDGTSSSSSSTAATTTTGASMLSMFGLGEKPTTAQVIQSKLNNAATAAVAAGEVPTFTEESAFSKCCPNLSYTQRLIGCVGCGVVGWVLALMGTLTLIGGPSQKNITTFAILYVVGNIVALAGTGFLLGPKTQCNKMWDPTRRFSTAFYLSMLIIVFSLAVTGQPVGLVIAMLVIQVLAASWYALSYVPFGRKMIITFFKRTCCKPCCDAYEESNAAKSGTNPMSQI